MKKKSTKVKKLSDEELDNESFIDKFHNINLDLSLIEINKLNSEESESSSNESEKSDNDKSKNKKITKKPVIKPEKNKRPPGRPRKNAPRIQINKIGIVEKPANEDAVVEFIYDKPENFKKIISAFKAISAVNIQMLFKPNELIMFAKDHHKKTNLYVKILGSKMNHYYCKNTIDMGITLSEMERIFNKIDKTYYTLIISVSEESTSKNIEFTFEHEMSINQIHTIDLIDHNTYDHLNANSNQLEEEFIDEDYTINFEYPGKFFKKTINDINSNSEHISFVQNDMYSYMCIKYVSFNKKTHSEHQMKDPKKIKFVSKLKNDENFIVKLKVELLKPVSAVYNDNDVKIYIDENKKFMTKSTLDNGAIEIKTTTDITEKKEDV